MNGATAIAVVSDLAEVVDEKSEHGALVGRALQMLNFGCRHSPPEQVNEGVRSVAAQRHSPLHRITAAALVVHRLTRESENIPSEYLVVQIKMAEDLLWIAAGALKEVGATYEV
jgi:hypothetical protein